MKRPAALSSLPSFIRIFSTSRKFLTTLFLEEYARWPLWWPVGMASGILVYFQLSDEPSVLLTYSLFILSFSFLGGLYYFLRNKSVLTESPLLFIVYALLSIMTGFTVAKVRTDLLATPLLNEKVPSIEVTGTLDEVEHPDLKHENKRRIVLSNLSYQPPIDSRIVYPTKVRLNTASTKLDAEPGDEISCQVSLLPISPPVSLQSYDFQRQAYFNGIGAVGRVLTPCQTLHKKPKTQLYQWRYLLTQTLRHHLPGSTGEIAAALVTGDRSGIPKDIRQHFSDSGIAHILAISGLHVSLVAAIIFFMIRRGLAFIPFLAENYQVKKWAAVIALIATGLYLAISGYGFPAIRSFIMTGLVMIGILRDRNPISMRSLAIAATFILGFYPESILSVSFQLSFAAVIALVSAYEGGYQPLKDWMYNQPSQRWFRRPLGYSVGIIFTTLIATLATTPIVIYTFNRFTLQAILGNLIAIPLTSLWIMPLAVLSIFSLAVGGIDFLFSLWGYGIKLMMISAEKVAALPGAAILVPTPHPAYLILTTLGGLWLCLWQQRWRWLGIILLVGTTALIFYDHHPDIYLAGDGSVIAYRQNKTLYVSSEKQGKFFYEQWARELGGLPIKPWPLPNMLIENKILLISDPYLQSAKTIEEICQYHLSAQIFSNGYIWRHCRRFIPSQHLIDRYQLRQKNSYFVYLNKAAIKVVNSTDTLGNRPWRLCSKKAKQ
jgi:competence protein ComEC